MATVTIHADRAPHIIRGREYSIFFVWDEAVSGFTTSDVTISNGTKGAFSGGGHVYRLVATAPTDYAVRNLTVTVAANAVTQGNTSTVSTIDIGSRAGDLTKIQPTTPIDAEAIAYDSNYIYAVGTSDDNLKQYSHTGEFNFHVYMPDVNNSNAIEIRDGNFIVWTADATHQFDILQPELWSQSNRYLYSQGANWLPPSSIYRNDNVVAGISINGRFVSLSSDLVPGPGIDPRYILQFSPRSGGHIGTTYVFIPASPKPTGIAWVDDYLLISYSSDTRFESETLRAYSVAGVRRPLDDIDLRGKIGFPSGSTKLGIISIDYDDVNDELWLLIRNFNASDVSQGQYFARLPLNPRVSWSGTSSITLSSGDTLDLNDYTEGATNFLFDSGFTIPSWLSLSNDILTVATTGLPPTGTELDVPLVAVGIGNPAYATIRMRLETEAPTWQDISEIIRDEGESVDINGFVEGADGITFQSGFVNTYNLDLSGGVITIPPNAVSTDTLVRVGVTATNIVGSTDTDFDLHITNSAVEFRNISFQHHLLDWRVTLGNSDLSADVTSVDNISHTLDLTDTGEFTVSECTVHISNYPRRYQRDGSFYEDNDIEVFKDTIAVSGGIIVGGQTVFRRMFTGVILDIKENISTQSVTLLCVERTQDLRENAVKNFGVEKRGIELIESSDGYEGTYRIPSSLTPVSDESLSARSGGADLNIVEDSELNIYGVLDSSNVKPTESTLRTEGGLLSALPVVSFKTSYSYEKTEVFLKNLMNELDIINLDIEPLSLVAPLHFSSIGRPGFNVETTDIVRYAKDWIYNATAGKIYLLSGSSYQTAQDYLWEWDIESDEWRILHQFGVGEETWQIASGDFNVFYILATQSRENINTIPTGTYDSSEGYSKVRIWRYTSNTRILDEFIASSDTYAPQLAQFYSVGFPRTSAADVRFGRLPDTRGGFEVRASKLYYRYATSTAYGIAEADADGTTREFVSGPGAPDEWGSASGCVFCIADDEMYVGYTHVQDDGLMTNPIDPSTVTIVKRGFTSSTITTVLTLQDPLNGVSRGSAHTIPDANKYSFEGVLEIFVHGTTCYFVTQRKDRLRGSQIPVRHVRDRASGLLYSISTTGVSTQTPTLLKTYVYSQTAARSFVVHNSMVHFFEGSHYTYKFPPHESPTLPGGQYLNHQLPTTSWRDKVGHLRRINGTTIEDVGVVWRSELTNPNDREDSFYGIHGGMASPMISADDSLYLIAAYGNFDEIGTDGSEINNLRNDVVIIYSTHVETRLPRIETNGKTGYAILQDVARSTNSIFGVNHQNFYWRSRENISAKVSAEVSITATSITFKDLLRTLPSFGYLRIGSEILSYSGATSTEMTGVIRGLAGTSAATHTVDDSILYVRHILEGAGAVTPITNVNCADDYSNLYNEIFVEYGDGKSIYHTSDSDSVDMFGSREYRISTMLDFTQIDWAKSLGDSYLATFKDLAQIVSFQTELALFLEIGDVVYLNTKNVSTVIRIYELNHDFQSRSTHITARSIV